MKYIAIIIVVIVLGVLVARSHKKNTDPAPFMSESAMAGPKTPAPVSEEKKETSLPNKNRTFTKNNMNIEVTKEGTGPEIVNGKMAVVTYVGKLQDGTVFDVSKNHGDGSFSFALGAGQVIKGWDQGVLGMKVGEKRTLTIPSDLAYGPNGIPGAIPPNATLIFDVELLAIK